MNSTAFSMPEDRFAPRVPQTALHPHESLLNTRLLALREIALSLLAELESLGHVAPSTGAPIRLDDEVKRFEMEMIRAALDRARGNQAKAARMLGVKHTTLNAKIKRYRIQPKDCDVDAAGKKDLAA